MKRSLVLVFLCAGLAVAAPSTQGAPSHRGSNSQTYQDSIAEDPNAPDITTVTVSNDDQGQITIHAAVANRPAFTDDMRGYLYFDTDVNANTGSPDWFGADVSIRVWLNNGVLKVRPYQWYADEWIALTPDSPFSYAYDSSGLTVSIGDSDLGKARVLRFLVHLWSGVTVDPAGNLVFSTGHDDYAPDGSVWLYRVQMPDRSAPRAHALAASGLHGRPINLRFRISDDSGQAREQLTILRSGRRVWTKTLPLHALARTQPESAVWPVAASEVGAFRFCVQAWDPAGNASRASCARVTVR